MIHTVPISYNIGLLEGQGSSFTIGLVLDVAYGGIIRL